MKPANFSSLVYRSFGKYLPPISQGACSPEIDGLFSGKGDASTAYFPPFAPSWETPEDPASRACISSRGTPVQEDSCFLEQARVKISLPDSSLNAARLSAPSLQKAEDDLSLPLDGELKPAEELMDFAPFSSAEMPAQRSTSEELLATRSPV